MKKTTKAVWTPSLTGSTLHPVDDPPSERGVLHKEGGAGPGSRLRGEERESEASSLDRGSRLETGREGTEFERPGSRQFLKSGLSPSGGELYLLGGEFEFWELSCEEGLIAPKKGVRKRGLRGRGGLSFPPKVTGELLSLEV